jgi:hypothetical protein
MARPIKPTPILTARQADQFLKKVERQLSEPLKVTAPPSLDRAIETAAASGFFKSK